MSERENVDFLKEACEITESTAVYVLNEAGGDVDRAFDTHLNRIALQDDPEFQAAEQRRRKQQQEERQKEERERAQEVQRNQELERERAQEVQRQQELEREREKARREEALRLQEQEEIRKERIRREQERQQREFERIQEENDQRVRQEQLQLQELERKNQEEKAKQEELRKQKLARLNEIAENERRNRKMLEELKRKEEEEKQVQALLEQKKKLREQKEQALLESVSNFERLKREKEERAEELERLEKQTKKAFDNTELLKQQTSEQMTQLQEQLKEREQLKKQAEEELRLIQQIREDFEKEKEAQERVREELRKKREEIERERAAQEELVRKTEALKIAVENQQEPEKEATQPNQPAVEKQQDETKATPTERIVQLFVGGQQPEQENNQIQTIINHLCSLSPSLSPSHFETVDYSRDVEIAAVLEAKTRSNSLNKSATTKTALPLVSVFVNSHFVGDVECVQNLTVEKLTKMLNDSAEEVDLGYLDKALNVTEYLVSGVSKAALLPVTVPLYVLSSIWSSLAGSSRTPEEEEKRKREEEEKKRMVDIEVIHTNWYWRHLRRVFRFTDSQILRLHPSYLSNVRAAHPYNSVLSLELVDAQNLIISYSDGSPADYVKATSANIQKMISLINERSTNPEKPTFLGPKQAEQSV